jgi:hypothetical protein
MAHHKRGRASNVRAACKMCKPESRTTVPPAAEQEQQREGRHEVFSARRAGGAQRQQGSDDQRGGDEDPDRPDPSDGYERATRSGPHEAAELARIGAPTLRIFDAGGPAEKTPDGVCRAAETDDLGTGVSPAAAISDTPRAAHRGRVQSARWRWERPGTNVASYHRAAWLTVDRRRG